jgi:hypothetical protein
MVRDVKKSLLEIPQGEATDVRPNLARNGPSIGIGDSKAVGVGHVGDCGGGRICDAEEAVSGDGGCSCLKKWSCQSGGGVGSGDGSCVVSGSGIGTVIS